METNEAWNKVDELEKHPELANTPGYEIENLREAVDPVYWFLLLMEQPQFEPEYMWWHQLRNRCDLPWAKLLVAQPQFEKYCHWDAVSRGELVTLAFLAPELFARKFPEGRWYDLYAFLTKWELVGVLRDAPQAVEKLDMEDVCKKTCPRLLAECSRLSAAVGKILRLDNGGKTSFFRLGHFVASPAPIRGSLRFFAIEVRTDSKDSLQAAAVCKYMRLVEINSGRS